METYQSLEHQLCFSLYATSREIVRRYKPFLDPFQLTYTQYVTLLVLWETPTISVKALGERLHLDSGTLTPLLKKLEAMELVRKQRSTQDERVVEVLLQPKGLQLKAQMAHIPKAMWESLPHQRTDLVALKEKVDALLNEL